MYINAEYEKLQIEHHQLTEKYNKLFLENKRLYNMLTPEQREHKDNRHVDGYIAWYIENYRHRPSQRLIEKFKELNGGVDNDQIRA